TFLKQSYEQNAKLSRAANEFLFQEADKLKARLEASEEKLQRYREDIQAVSLEERQNIIVDKLKEINAQVNEAKAERLRLESDLEQIKHIDPNNTEELMRIESVAKLPQVAEVRFHITRGESELAVLRKRYLPDHPKYIQGLSQMANLGQSLAAAVRGLGARMAKSTERKGALLVIGSGEDAVQFHRSFRRMGDPHAIRFIDPCVETNSRFLLDGPGSPAVDPRWERRIALAGSRYDAVILARNPSELPAPLTQKLVDIHFHKIPVLTVEAFFETHWRRVYLHGVSPKWIFQE